MFPDSGAVAHSLRVGFATELFAAGVKVAIIMELGRWSSYAALLYVLPSATKLLHASRAIGTGDQLQIDAFQLRRTLMTQEPGAIAGVTRLGPRKPWQGSLPPPACPPAPSSPAGLPAPPKPSMDPSAEGTPAPGAGSTRDAASTAPSTWIAYCAACGALIPDDEDGHICQDETCSNRSFNVCDECFDESDRAHIFCPAHRLRKRAKGYLVQTVPPVPTTMATGPLSAGLLAHQMRATWQAAEAENERAARRLLGLPTQAQPMTDGGDGRG